jgi:hypothetical protein
MAAQSSLTAARSEVAMRYAPCTELVRKARSYDEAVGAQPERGKELVLNGTFSGILVAYLPTDRDSGVLLEVCQRYARHPQIDAA